MGEIPEALVEKVAKEIAYKRMFSGFRGVLIAMRTEAENRAAFEFVWNGTSETDEQQRRAYSTDARTALAVVWPAIEAAQGTLREGMQTCAANKQCNASCEIFTKIHGCCPECPVQWVEDIGPPLSALGLDPPA